MVAEPDRRDIHTRRHHHRPALLAVAVAHQSIARHRDILQVGLEEDP